MPACHWPPAGSYILFHTRHLICTDVQAGYDTIIDLCKNRFKGKTLIMCPEVRDCVRLQKSIPDSFVVVSSFNHYASNKGVGEAMREVRDYIAQQSIEHILAPDVGAPEVILSHRPDLKKVRNKQSFFAAIDSWYVGRVVEFGSQDAEELAECAKRCGVIDGKLGERAVAVLMRKLRERGYEAEVKICLKGSV